MIKFTSELLELIDQVYELGRLGLSDAQCAAELDCSLELFRHSMVSNPELASARQRGLNNSIISASRTLLAKIAEGDVGAARFLLERKGGWTNEPIEVSLKPSAKNFKLVGIPAADEDG